MSYRWLILSLLAVLLCWPLGGYAQEPAAYVDYYKKPDKGSKLRIEGSRAINELAKEITAGCNDKYDRIKAIYQWICANIAYDTSYKIRSADECLKKRRGVCQAYCELFYLLAKAVDVDVEIVEGKSKDQTGFVNPSGHGWLFAYTRDNYGILMDPTWGAGSVAGDQFVRDENCWLWFNVPPEWMIMSHFPDKPSYQLLDKPITQKDFMALTPMNPIWLDYGLDAHRIYTEARAQQLALPQFYNQSENLMELSDIPYATSLRIGTQYPFRIKMKASDRDFAIWNNSYFCGKELWKDEGNGVYSVSFVPRETGTLSIVMRDDQGASWQTLLKYDIAEPTETDWSQLAQYYPASTPEMKAIKNLNVKEWNDAGIDEHQLVRLIKEGDIKELPLFYDGKGQLLSIDTVPMTQQLKVGETYAFSFTPRFGFKWAVVAGSDWFTDWTKEESGRLSLSVEPKTAGKLSLCVQMSQGESYWSCLEYEVVQ